MGSINNERRQLLRLAALAAAGQIAPAKLSGAKDRRLLRPNQQTITGIDLLLSDTPPADPFIPFAHSGNASGEILYLVGTETGGIGSGGREVLTADRDYYVRTDGSDSNDGLTDSAGGAFETINYAIEIAAALDLSIYDVYINIGSGTFTENIILKGAIGAGSIKLIGAGEGNTVLDVESGNIVERSAFDTPYYLSDCTIGGNDSASNGIQAAGSGIIYVSGVSFEGVYQNHVRALDYGIVELVGDYEIAGDAKRHWRTTGGLIRAISLTLTLTGTPEFTRFAEADRQAMIYCQNITFTGGAIGSRYDVYANAIINTNGEGATYLPGDVAGSESTGGLYI